MRFLKEFLKPNRWKIGIVALMIGANFLAFDTYYEIFPPPGGVIGQVLFQIVTLIVTLMHWIFILPVVIPLVIIFAITGANWPMGREMIITLVAALPYWYLLSCLIYFVFSKRKKVLQKQSAE